MFSPATKHSPFAFSILIENNTANGTVETARVTTKKTNRNKLYSSKLRAA